MYVADNDGESALVRLEPGRESARRRRAGEEGGEVADDESRGVKEASTTGKEVEGGLKLREEEGRMR